MIDKETFVEIALSVSGLTREELYNNHRRKGLYSATRFLIYYYMRQEGYSNSAIRGVLNSNESSVVYGIRTAGYWKDVPAYTTERYLMQEYERELKKIKKCLVY